MTAYALYKLTPIIIMTVIFIVAMLIIEYGVNR